jgi:hypothetical protein
LGRIVNLEGAGKERTNLTRSVLVAIHELMRQQEINSQTRDLAAYLYFALQAIAATIETSVGAWEKRGYWLKADRFRLEWEWAAGLSQKLKTAVLSERWDEVAGIAVQISGKLANVSAPKRGYKTEFWQGSWEKLKNL